MLKIFFVTALFAIFSINASAVLIDKLLEKTVDVKCKMAIIEAKKGNFKKAETLFEGALIQTRYAPDVLSDYIRILSWEHKYSKILKAADKFAKGAKVNEEVRAIIAMAQLNSGDAEQALKFYQGALSKHNGDETYIVGYVKACVKLKKFKKAHELLSREYGKTPLSMTRKLFLNNQMSLVLHQDAVFEARNEKYSAALRNIRRAVTLSIDKEPVIVDMIVILVWAGKYREALLNFRGLELSMMPSGSAAGEASSNENLGTSIERAKTLMDKRVPPYLLKTVAWAACQNKEFSVGAELYSRYLRINPKDADALKAFKHANLMVKDQEERERLKLSAVRLKQAEKTTLGGKVDSRDSRQENPVDKPPATSDIGTRETRAKQDQTGDAGGSSKKSSTALSKYSKLLAYVERESRDALDTMRLYAELLRSGRSGKIDWSTVLGMNPGQYDVGIAFVVDASKNGIISPEKASAIVCRLRHEKAIALARSGKTSEALAIMAALYEQLPEDISILSDYLVILSWSGKWEQTVAEYSKLSHKVKSKLPPYALLEVAVAFKNTREYDHAVKLIKHVLAEEPRNVKAWMLLGFTHKRQREFMSAYTAFAQAAKYSDGSQKSVDAKYRLLADVMAVGGAMDLMRMTGEKVSPQVGELLRANEAALRIQWKEPKKAVVLLNRNLRMAGVANLAKPTRNELENPVVRRAFFDRILAYDHEKDMKKAVRDLDLMNEYGIETPVWLAAPASDALLYVRRPEDALKKCDDALAELTKNGQNHYPANYEPLIMRFYALVDLERHDEAKKVIEKLMKSIQAYSLIHGVYRKDWNLATVLNETAWWNLYNDQPAKAERKFENLLDKAPNNSNFLSGLAYAHYYRGWPRMAHEEFAMVKTIDPELMSAKIGYCRTLNELDQGQKAREIAAELAKKHPRDLRIKRLERDFELQDMRTLSLDVVGSTTTFDTFFEVKLRLEQPIEPDRSVYSETEWMYRKRNHGEEKKDYKSHIVRGRVGADWRLSRDLYSRAAISFPLDGSDDVGGALGFTYQNDYWTISTDFDSRTTDMPTLALHAGLYGLSMGGEVNYRSSEKFNTTVSYRNLYLSDHNDMNQVGLTLDRQLYSSARVKLRLALLNDLEMWKRKNPEVGYYSPRLAYTCQLAPMVEHTWYKRYDTSFTNRLTCGGGFKSEKDYSVYPVGFAKFEEDCRFTDTFSVLVGSTVSYDVEDGDGSMGLAVFLKMRWRF